MADQQKIDSLTKELQDAQPRTPLDENDPARRARQMQILEQLDRARTGTADEG